MNVKRCFTCRGVRSKKQWATATMIALLVSTTPGPGGAPTVRAQGPVDQGFNLNAGDLRFILRQIKIAENHAAGGSLLGPAENQVSDPRHPYGLRTVDGSFNNLIAGQEMFGAADRPFPRMTTPNFRAAENWTTDPDGPGPVAVGSSSSYAQKKGLVNDSSPRVISNLISDQTTGNPAAVTAAGGGATPDPSGSLFIPNVAPDVGLSAPYNSMFTLFGQFFDHGLDLVTKGGGTVFVPLRQDDPLYNPTSQTNFMVVTRATNQPGPDGILGDTPGTPIDESADDVQDGTNTTTPFVDQNQTYTSHPSHQVFLRDYVMNGGKPIATGRLKDGAIAGNIANWADVKTQALAMLGIRLVDSDIFNVPLLATDPYGRFLRGSNGFPQMVMADGGLVQGNLTTPITTVGARKTGHAFLDDIAHNAAPKSGLAPDGNNTPGAPTSVQPANTYDDELLNAHFITGDGRGNENIGLTAIHTLFHAEHNRLVGNIHDLINSALAADEIADWNATDPASGWDYGERLFQAARFVTEMEYQHLVFEEFGRKIQPQINVFAGYHTDIDPAIAAEFAHTVYRFGHSMLTETVARTHADGTTDDIPLLDAFLNPLAFNHVGGATLTAAQAAGSIVQGMTHQVGNEMDEFVTEALRNRLLGLPLDLGTINIVRGRSEGIPRLNAARRQFFEATGNAAVAPYENWFDFSFALRHPESVANFVAAYGTHPTLAAAATVAAKRTAAEALISDSTFMFAPGNTTGVEDIDFWIGGLAEKQAPFGGLLGPTFNHVFETQLERLQDGDRFYYLSRTVGLNLLVQLEGNSFAELAIRNTTASGLPADVFSRADLVFNLANLGTTGAILDDPGTEYNESTMPDLVRLPNGTIRYAGPLHVVWNGTDDPTRIDRIYSSEGDDTLRGSGGRDIMEGGAGNDQFTAGDGDDILTDAFGDDVLKGGDGHDAMSSGQGFDLNQGGLGKDFIVGGSDPTETFGGPDDDLIFAGDSSDTVFGDDGDDWIEGGNQADLLQGDAGNPFQDDPDGGHDIIIGGGGNDDYDSEGGDDIMVSGPGIERNEGMLGFDWVTHKNDPQPADADMLLVGLLPPNVEDLRDRFDGTEGLSGWKFNDLLRGDDRIDTDMVGHELNAAGIARIAGLKTVLGGAGVTSFTGGNIILGGAGGDLIEGRGGNDILDGDAWLDVQLEAPDLVNGGRRRVDSMTQLRTDVFAGRINPGDITIVRRIVTTGVAPADVDTAVFSGARAEYDITGNANGSVTVSHTGGTTLDGIDILRNIEELVFSDQTITIPISSATRSVVPNVAGQTQAAATTVIADAGLTAGTITFENSETVAAGRVIRQAPAATTTAASLSEVSLVVSLGRANVQVPGVFGKTEADARVDILAAELTVGAVTTGHSTTIGAGGVMSQTPAAGASVAPASAVALVISLGSPEVQMPGLIGLTEAEAMTSIAAAGLTVGSLTRQHSDAPAGLVISQAPAPESGVTPGSAVSFVVSLGLPPVTVPDVVGLSVASARLALTGRALTVGRITAENSADVPLNRIISQAPLAGASVVQGSAVALVRSLGPAVNAVVPNLVGLTQAQAIAELTDSGFAAGAITTESHASVPFGRVISQTPSAGPNAPEGSAVAFVVSRGPVTSQPAGLVLDLRLDEASGTTAADSSPTGLNSGVVRQAQFVPGRTGNALSFDGVDDWVTVLDANSLDLTSGLTLEAWVKPAAMSGRETVIHKQRGTGNSYALYAHDDSALATGEEAAPSGTLRFGTQDRRVKGTAALPLNTWSHIATTYDGVEQRFYVNGAVVATRAQTSSIATGTGVLRLGGNAAFTGEFFEGLIDEVRVYNRALDASEIALDMNGGAEPPPADVEVPDLVGMTEAAATTALNVAGLTVGIVTPAEHASMAAGNIISHTPAAGASATPGSPVSIVVSLGPATVALPNVVNLTQGAAETAITGATLAVGSITTANHATVVAGNVISQSPTFPGNVPAGSAVSIVVSLGPATVALPNVVNLTQAAAQTAITGASLTVGTITTANHATVVAGNVISQSPTFPGNVPAGSAVSIVVSLGPVPTGLPAPWATEDVGVVGLAGSASYAPATGTYSVTGAGADIWGTADAFRYVHQPLNGDGQIVARVASVQNTNAWVKAGVMIRASLTAGSQHGIMFVTPTVVKGNNFQRRLVAGGVSTGTTGALVAPPYWVKLTRSGNTITAYQSVDGNTWSTVGSATIAMPASVLVGLAVSSHSAATLATATFDQVAVGPLVVANVPVPNVVNLTQAAAETAITGATLTVGTITTANHPTVPAGNIISQTPPFPGNVPASSAVAIVVSLGPATGGDTIAPVAVVPAQNIDLSSLQPTTVPVKITWSATDNVGGSGLARYEVQRSNDGGTTWAALSISTPLSTAVTVSLTPGTTATTNYRFRVRAVDVAGNVGAYATAAAFRIAVDQENAAGIVYAGTWTASPEATASGGSQTNASVAGATATYTFTGSNIAWAAVKHNSRGRAEVRIDGALISTIDLFQTSATASNRLVVFQRAVTPGIAHTIEVRVLGTKAAASTGTRIDVDAFVVAR